MSKAIDDFFTQTLHEKLAAKPPSAAQKSAVIRIDLTGDGGGTWTIDLSTSPAAVVKGALDDPTCTIELACADFEAMLEGRANAMRLFMQRKIKVTGSMSHATFIQTVVD